MSGLSPKWWQFFPKDFFADSDVQDMSAENQAYYLLVLAWIWEREAILRDPVRTMRKIGFLDPEGVWDGIKHLFASHLTTGEDDWIQTRQRRDYIAACAARFRAVQRSKRGHEVRWGRPDPDAPSNA